MSFLFAFLGFFTFISVTLADSRPALPHEFPFEVSISSVRDDHLCGGVIITSTWVLTAADCIERHIFETWVTIKYGSSNHSDPPSTVRSRRIELQNGTITGVMALIELESEIEMSANAKPAKLPKRGVSVLTNTTKLCGWMLHKSEDNYVTLHVVDRFLMKTENCTSKFEVLEPDQLCGSDLDSPNVITLHNLGSSISKAGILIGLLTKPPIGSIMPSIYIKVSEHEDWIKDVLGKSSANITWVNEIPKNSANHHGAASFIFISFSVFFAIFLSEYRPF